MCNIQQSPHGFILHTPNETYAMHDYLIHLVTSVGHTFHIGATAFRVLDTKSEELI